LPGVGIQIAGKAAYLEVFAEDDPVSPDVIVTSEIRRPSMFQFRLAVGV